MSEKLYEAIKTKFDADGTLVSSPFAALYLSSPSDADLASMPYCVLLPDEVRRVERMFNGDEQRMEAVSFHIIGQTLATLGGYDDLVETAFQDCESDLNGDSGLQAAGITVQDMHKIAGRHEEGEYAWESVQQYEIIYTKAA